MKSLGSLAAMLALGATSAPAQTPACCTITTIEAATGLVSAKVAANNQVFQFKVADARALSTLRVGQGVFANFTTRQVSLDGRSACCAITSGPTAPTAVPGRQPLPVTPAPAPAPAPPPARPAPAPAPSPGGVAAAGPAVFTGAIPNTLPSISYGPPQPRTSVLAMSMNRFESKAVTALVGGRQVTATVLRLRGLEGIKNAPGLNEDARKLLKMHVKTLAAGEPAYYIVNPQLAEEWIKAHSVPSDVKPADEGGGGSDCSGMISMNCLQEGAQNAWDMTVEEFERFRKRAQDAWDKGMGKLAEAWGAAVGCFTERNLPLRDIPVQFSITPSMTVSMEQSSSKGSGSGTLKGTVGLGFPMQADFAAELDLFYIQCLPFYVRPKALSANGILTVGQVLTGDVSANGQISKTFTIPPTGGPVIPIQVIPIVIGGVPVAELDISAYIEGNIEVGAEGQATGQFKLTNSNPTRFDFSCDGKGCRATSKGLPAPTTASEAAQIQGKVFVKPAIYTALQLDFNYQALSARAGPEPYLIGRASGCADAAGTQTSGGAATAQENHAFTADLDWGMDLRAEALTFRTIIGTSYVTPLIRSRDNHLWFRDLAPGGSNALEAMVQSAGQATVGTRADHKVRMPSCYPKAVGTDKVKYQVSWTGNASPAPSPANAGCSWQPAQSKGSCTFDPTKDLVISLVWPAAGNYTLTVAPVGDAHDRVFAPTPKVTQLNVSVAP